MVAKFDVVHWRDVIRACNAVIATNDKDRILTKYMDFVFDLYDRSAVVYGSNGCMITRVTVPCEIKDIPKDYHLLIPPLKIPAHTKSIEIHIDEEKKEYTIIFIDSEDEIIDTFISDFVDGQPLDYESFYKKAQDNFESHSKDGTGKYFIAVNPKYLLAALEGLKSCDSVIMNFGSVVQPFTIRPYDGDIDATALVYPIRVM